MPNLEGIVYILKATINHIAIEKQFLARGYKILDQSLSRYDH